MKAFAVERRIGYLAPRLEPIQTKIRDDLQPVPGRGGASAQCRRDERAVVAKWIARAHGMIAVIEFVRRGGCGESGTSGLVAYAVSDGYATANEYMPKYGHMCRDGLS